MGIPNDSPWSWRKILGLRSLVQDFMSIELGDGSPCYLFYDIWCGVRRLKDRVPNFAAWGSSLLMYDWRMNGRWCIPMIFEDTHLDITQEMRICIGYVEADKPIWKASANGNFFC